MKRVALLATLVSMVGVGVGAGTAACKRSEAPPAAQAPESASSGSAAPGSAGAPAADPWQAAPPKKDPLPHPLFWAIEKDGKTTYLLGTFHVGIDAETRLPDLVWKKLDAAPTFAMEANLDEISPRDMVRNDNGTLHADLGKDYWAKLETVLTPQAAKAIDSMKPMVAAMQVSLHGIPPTTPMDGILVSRATNEHKQVVYLEAAAKQMKLLEKWMDVRALKAMLDDVPAGERRTKEMVAAYIAGDDAKIVALSDSERDDALEHGYTQAEFDQEMNDMLYDRNKSWIDAIEQLHASGGGFIAVGALHLVGKDSVLELLQHKGYKVTRVQP